MKKMKINLPDDIAAVARHRAAKYAKESKDKREGLPVSEIISHALYMAWGIPVEGDKPFAINLNLAFRPSEADKLAIFAEVNGEDLADYARKRLLFNGPPIPHTVNKERIQELERQWLGSGPYDNRSADNATLNAIAQELPSLVHQRLQWNPDLTPKEIAATTDEAFRRAGNYQFAENGQAIQRENWGSGWKNPIVWLCVMFTPSVIFTPSEGSDE